MLVVGNWKMNGSLTSAEELASAIARVETSATVVVCPPLVFLQAVAGCIENTVVALGAQNVLAEPSGAFTGEVSVSMLRDVGCSYCIVGHSERRSLFGESDELVVEKFVACQQAGLTPIFCVGESLQEREEGLTSDVVGSQIDALLNDDRADAFENAVIAYEPVWAIGTGKTASPEQAEEVHALIRSRLCEKNKKQGALVPLLYGGSVNETVAKDLFAMQNIDGALVGGASLKADAFMQICQAAS